MKITRKKQPEAQPAETKPELLPRSSRDAEPPNPRAWYSQKSR